MSNERVDLDLLSKKGGNKEVSIAILQSVFQQIIESIQHDMGGEHSDDMAGVYSAQECGSPIDDAARQVSVCNHPDPNAIACPEEHCALTPAGKTISVNPTGTLIQLFADKSDLRGRSADLVRGLYTEIRLLKNGKIQLTGYVHNTTQKKIKFDLFFTLEGGATQ